MIEFGSEVCRDLNSATTREWLETNGIGGFASSTVAGLNTRRYHGLLVAATRPPVGRMVLLSKIEETLILDGRRYELSANQYPGVVHPHGHQYLVRFRLDPFPTFTYEVEGVEVEKALFMIRGENGTVITYRVRNAPVDCVLEVRPLIAFRDYHSTTHENGALNRNVAVENGLAGVAPYPDLPVLFFGHDAASIDTTGYWFRNFEYEREQERGLDFVEDLFSPFALRFDLAAGGTANVIASTERRAAGDAEGLRRAEIQRRSEIVAASPSQDPLVRSLVAAADQYIAARGTNQTVIAGYHWFSDWGRDTMIALPGLTIVTGRADVARNILLEFSKHVDKGMLPNRFPDAGEEPEYNTVDATLWFFEAVRSLIAYTGDYEFVRKNLYEILRDVIDWHVRGTRYGIRMDEDGLLEAGEEGVQLTWMDAKVGDWVVTPRHGKPVEIQALWFNALCVIADLADKFTDRDGAKLYSAMAEAAKRSFNRLFWNEEAGCLFDVVRGDQKDASIRPNQIFAVSLPHTMLSRDRGKQVVEVVERHLLTPFGLRSLAPGDPQYRGRYEGDPWSRDSAYHQGTVWPWLMGPFISAYVRVHGRSKKARENAARLLTAFSDHLSEAGLGHISEIFDADAPHASRGCIAQAWSVAEVMRAALEDVLGIEQSASRSVGRQP